MSALSKRLDTYAPCVPAEWTAKALETAQALDPSDPSGSVVSQRELHAAGSALARELRQQHGEAKPMGDVLERIATTTGATFATSITHEVPEGPTYSIT